MTLISRPGSWPQIAGITIDAATARDTALMLTGAHAVLAALAGGEAPAAALDGADSPYTLSRAWQTPPAAP